jgi:hypothetical protein
VEGVELDGQVDRRCDEPQRRGERVRDDGELHRGGDDDVPAGVDPRVLESLTVRHPLPAPDVGVATRGHLQFVLGHPRNGGVVVRPHESLDHAELEVLPERFVAHDVEDVLVEDRGLEILRRGSVGGLLPDDVGTELPGGSGGHEGGEEDPPILRHLHEQ